MNYKNGYKVVYEVAAGGERAFYASKSNSYPNDEDVLLATFKDAEFAGKTIYEYAGEFYVADTAAAKFNEEGKPTGSKLEGDWDEIFVAKDANETPVEVTDPVTTNTDPEDELDGEPEDETETETEVDE